jgi:hypothetical protein
MPASSSRRRAVPDRCGRTPRIRTFPTTISASLDGSRPFPSAINNPILQPWASDKIRKRNELILSGKPVFSPHASCWPIGVLEFVLSPMTRPLYFVQGPKEVVMILTSFSDVRRVYLADKHSANVKTSWYGESSKAIRWSSTRSASTTGRWWTNLGRRTPKSFT